MEKRSENRKRKRVVRIIFAPLLLVGLVLAGMMVFSPYKNTDGYNYPVIRTETTINVPVDSVFRYLGNSGNASRWSVFVSKIIPLNSDKAKDGAVGSRRRCYGKEDETLQWDELTTVVEKNKRRQLTIYNMKNFPLKASGLATEQNYFALGKNRTKLVFTVFYKDRHTIWEMLKTYLAAYKIRAIFNQNLLNIKVACERGKPLV